MGREHQKKKMIILFYPNPRSSPTFSRYLGIQFVTFSFLYSHEYILSFSIGVFFFFLGGGQGFMFSVVPSSVLFCCALIGAFGGRVKKPPNQTKRLLLWCYSSTAPLPRLILGKQLSHTHTHTFLHKIKNFTNM